MAGESIQKKLSRVRPPRVHITYDVETGGSIEKKELPFVVGVLADLSGNSKKPPVKDRKFVQVDRYTLDDVIGKIKPSVVAKIPNRLQNDDTVFQVNLEFNKMDDFEPAAVAKQVTPIRKLLELRQNLANLRSSLAGNEKLDGLLQDILKDSEKLAQAGAEAGIRRSDQSTADSPKEDSDGK